MKLELIGHDEKYALEQSLLTLFPGEKPVYGTVDKTADTRWARVTLTEEDERVQVTTELGVDGKSAAHSYDYPLSGTEYEKEGQRRHAVGISFFGAAKDLLGISPAWGSLTGVRPSKVALSLIREGGKKGYFAPTYLSIKPTDTTGAGDSFCAGFLAGLAQDFDFEKSAKLGNAVGTHCVMELGASTGIKPLAEIYKFMEEHTDEVAL